MAGEFLLLLPVKLDCNWHIMSHLACNNKPEKQDRIGFMQYDCGRCQTGMNQLEQYCCG